MDRALKHGLGGIIKAGPFDYNQSEMFATLQRLTLLHRLNDSYTCLVSNHASDLLKNFSNFENIVLQVIQFFL